jgi:hypothetical protein
MYIKYQGNRPLGDIDTGESERLEWSNSGLFSTHQYFFDQLINCLLLKEVFASSSQKVDQPVSLVVIFNGLKQRRSSSVTGG